MWHVISTIAQFLFKVISTKDSEGSLKWGARHTTIAASILGLCQLGAMSNLYYTRQEAIPLVNKIELLQKDQNDTKVFIAQKLQEHTDKLEYITSELKEIHDNLQLSLEALKKKRDQGAYTFKAQTEEVTKN